MHVPELGPDQACHDTPTGVDLAVAPVGLAVAPVGLAVAPARRPGQFRASVMMAATRPGAAEQHPSLLHEEHALGAIALDELGLA